MFWFAAGLETLPNYVYPALNFPINIRRASVFQMAPLSKDSSFSLSLSAQPEQMWMASSWQINWKQASNHTHSQSLGQSDTVVC